MGTVFSLYKRKPKQRYELGKPRHGYAPGLAPPETTLIEKIGMLSRALRSIMGSPSIRDLSEHYAAMTALTNPGWGALWSIMGTDNYSVFRLSRFTREDLADRLYQGSQNIDTMEDALKVADHILVWAGDDEVTLNPEEPNDLAELGWPIRGYKDIGGIWDAMK